VPPEAYLILSSELLPKRRSWLSLGLWDPRRAHIARRSQVLSREEAVAELAQHFGYSEQEAEKLYTQVRERTVAGQSERFTTPVQSHFVSQWLPCRAVRDTSETVCELQAGTPAATSTLQAFVYNPTSPQDARLHIRQRQGGALSGRTTEGTPAVVIMAGTQGMQETAFTSPTHPDLGVLVDMPNQRVLVGAPPLVRSTFVHLMYLDGRYTTHYEKFDDKTTEMGERIVTWKINWKGR
jgi:hypothetical protein